ncbi:Zn(2)-C6 fungal-type DNA-binding domain protein [Niveomyces insectorum RCEF 264]|uniref:Zn(2)-C6 fungal-type DNA-binding domain protein n=1 Tax=Niveomyces insectorum RCEF 264 TaxID=1081102 RepID=A0A167Y5H0_9HYPO|nr:Zn(2)-C6 fungal-type DNA-binding domain protein [Niveomyces insectorum RCEF 264]
MDSPGPDRLLELQRKCSEDVPACSACVRRNLKCEYGIRLSWQDEAESLGIAFGRALKNRYNRASQTGHPEHAAPAAPLEQRHYLLPLRDGSVGRHWLNTSFADVRRLCTPATEDRHEDASFVSTHSEEDRDDPAVAAVPPPLSAFPGLEDDGCSVFLEYCQSHPRVFL